MSATTTARLAHPCHLGDGGLGRREVVQRAAAHDQVERRVEERERGSVPLLEEHVGDAGLAQSGRAHLEQGGRQVEADHLAYARRGLFGGVCGAARHVEDDHVRVERLQPRQRRRRSVRERRVLPRKQVSLPLERLPHNGVVVVRVHRRRGPSRTAG
jgi:hypothetical protein